MNLFSRQNIDKKENIGDKVVGKDMNENSVYRCEKTQLLYVLGKPPKKYISVKDVKFTNEK